MRIQSDLLAEMKVFSARLEDASEKFAETNRRENIAGATGYLSKQLVLLTDMNAALCTAVISLANEVDRLKG